MIAAKSITATVGSVHRLRSPSPVMLIADPSLLEWSAVVAACSCAQWAADQVLHTHRMSIGGESHDLMVVDSGMARVSAPSVGRPSIWAPVGRKGAYPCSVSRGPVSSSDQMRS